LRIALPIGSSEAAQNNQREVFRQMNTETALAQLGISAGDLTPEQRRKFDEEGYFIVENVFTPAEVEEMRAEFDRLRSIEGDLGGHEVHIEPGAPRLSNLFNKSPAFDRCLSCKPTLAAAAHLLGEIRVYSLNARNPLKGEGQQPLHSDVPRVTPKDWRVVNSMIMLDDMTPTNGPTRVVPGSHKWTPINVPDNNMGELERVVARPEDAAEIPKDPYAPHPRELKLTGKAGSVAVINGHIWHGGTRNESGASRRVLHLAIGRRDLLAQLNEREHLTPDLLARTSPSQQFLLDIEGATPKVTGYPPLPTSAPTWASIETLVADPH
jgi:ectoine hydroxylase-related dioxygenase (phytanoyl-CoA dioxygenase family)